MIEINFKKTYKSNIYAYRVKTPEKKKAHLDIIFSWYDFFELLYKVQERYKTTVTYKSKFYYYD